MEIHADGFESPCCYKDLENTAWGPQSIWQKEQVWLFGLTGDADLCAVAAALLSDNLRHASQALLVVEQDVGTATEQASYAHVHKLVADLVSPPQNPFKHLPKLQNC